MPCSNDTKILIVLMKIFFDSKGGEGSDYFCSSNFTHMARGNSGHSFFICAPFCLSYKWRRVPKHFDNIFCLLQFFFQISGNIFIFFAIISVKYSLKKWLVMALKWLQKGPKMLNFPGRCPWTPLGGSEHPQILSSLDDACGLRPQGVVFAAKPRIVALPLLRKNFHIFCIFTP